MTCVFFSIKDHVVIFQTEKSDFRKITCIHEMFTQEFEVSKIEQILNKNQKHTMHMSS